MKHVFAQQTLFFHDTDGHKKNAQKACRVLDKDSQVPIILNTQYSILNTGIKTHILVSFYASRFARETCGYISFTGILPEKTHLQLYILFCSLGFARETCGNAVRTGCLSALPHIRVRGIKSYVLPENIVTILGMST